MELREVITNKYLDAINEFLEADKRLKKLLPKIAGGKLVGKVIMDQETLGLIDKARRDIDHAVLKMIDAMTYFTRMR